MTPNTNPTDSPTPDYERPYFPWDDWEAYALEQGMDEKLAGLGRAVMREASQHSWDPMVAELCSEWVMEPFFKRAPDLAKRLYEVLLETDGLRYAWVEEEGSSDMIELCGCRY